MNKRIATIYSGLLGLLAAVFILGSFGSSEVQAEGIWYVKQFDGLCSFQCEEYQPPFCNCVLHDTIIVE